MTAHNSLILAIVGPIGSGKGTVSSYIERRYGAVTFKSSKPLRRILEILDIEVSRSTMQFLSQLLRENYGQDSIARIAKREVANSDSRISIIDGARRIPDIAPFLDLPNFVLIYIEADEQVRYSRITKRAENAGDSEKTFDEFLQEEQGEPERNTRSLREKAKFIIDNSTDEAELMERVDVIMSELLD